MISLDRASYQVQPRYAEYTGLSTDAKPVEVDNGDEFQEIDTGFIYKFDETNTEWVKQPTGGGGTGTNDYNDLINLPQINGVELIGNKTSAELEILNNYPIVNEVSSSVTLEPNTFYLWGEMSQLDISLGTEENSIVNEFCGQFVSGIPATSFSIPVDVKWVDGLIIPENSLCQFSIVNNVGVMISVEA